MAIVASTPLPSDLSFGEMLSVGDVLERLGGISPRRIPLGFSVGNATEEDLLNLLEHGDRICELVDGVLVEKVMGWPESVLASEVVFQFKQFLKSHNFGVVSGEAGLMRILPKQIRVPDVGFVRWERLPERKMPKERVLACAPNIAVEILSPSNTRGEMSRKLDDYFTAGVQLVWYIDPDTRTAQAFESVDRVTNYTAVEQITAGDVLPGFSLLLVELFAELDKVG